MGKMKRVVSLVLVLCMAISMAVLFCGCDEYDSMSGSKLPAEWIGTYTAFNNCKGSVTVKAKDGDGIYWTCPKFYGNKATILTTAANGDLYKDYKLFNETIQTIRQKVDRNDDDKIIRRYNEYRFDGEDLSMSVTKELDCVFYKANDGCRYLNVNCYFIEHSAVGSSYIMYYGTSTFKKV